MYAIRGFGAKRAVPSFDDLLFLGASVSRYPLEGYREACGTNVVLGPNAARPVELDIPVTIAGSELRRTVGEREGGTGPRGVGTRHHRNDPVTVA